MINTDLTDLNRNGQNHSGIGQDILHMVKPPKTLDPTFPMIQFNSVFHEPNASEPQSFCHKCKPHTHAEITSSNCFHSSFSGKVNFDVQHLRRDPFILGSNSLLNRFVYDQNAEVSESGSEKVYVPIIILELVTCVVIKTALK